MPQQPQPLLPITLLDRPWRFSHLYAFQDLQHHLLCNVEVRQDFTVPSHELLSPLSFSMVHVDKKYSFKTVHFLWIQVQHFLPIYPFTFNIFIEFPFCHPNFLSKRIPTPLMLLNGLTGWFLAVYTWCMPPFS